MFETIRQKIRENRLAEALHVMDDLPVLPEHRSHLLNLHRRFRAYQDKAINNLTEDRLLQIEENGIVGDMLMFLDMVEFPSRSLEAADEETVPAGATTEKVITKTTTHRDKKGISWWPILAGLLLVAVLGFWLFGPKSSTGSDGEARVERVENPPRSVPEDTDEKKPEPTTPGRVPEGKLTIDPDLLRRPDLSTIKDIKLDPSVISRTLEPALMTQGAPVDVAVAVYRNRKSPTQYDAALSKSFAIFLGNQLSASFAYDVLTETFHELDERERLVFRGTMTDSRLSAKRARYLLLVDIRNLKTTNEAEYRLCLYDVNRQRGIPKSTTVKIGSWTDLQQKEMLYQARDFLKDLTQRGFFSN